VGSAKPVHATAKRVGTASARALSLARSIVEDELHGIANPRDLRDYSESVHRLIERIAHAIERAARKG